MAATAETLMAVLSLYWSIEHFDEYSDDVDNIIDFANENVAIGEAYKEKYALLHAEDQPGYDFINSMPDYERCDKNAKRAAITAQLNARNQLKGILSVADADDAGTRYTVLEELCEFESIQGAASIVDALNFEEAIVDAHVQARARAVANSESPATPDLGSAFRTIASVYVDNSERHAAGFNAAFFTLTRSVGSLYNRSLDSRAQTQERPLIIDSPIGNNLPGATPPFVPNNLNA